MERLKIDRGEVNEAMCQIYSKTNCRLSPRDKGDGVLVSRHEILGVVIEEVRELERAVESSTLASISDELLDIAVACVVGLASIRTPGSPVT